MSESPVLTEHQKHTLYRKGCVVISRVVTPDRAKAALPHRGQKYGWLEWLGLREIVTSEQTREVATAS